MVELSASEPYLDLFFPVRGTLIPVDHGYSLYAALALQLESPGDPWLHASGQLGVHLIRGRYQGRGHLALTSRSSLGLRLPSAFIHRFLPLAGKRLILGDSTISLGIPQPHALQPAANLYAHLVTTRNGEDETRFDEEIARQLAAQGIQSKAQRGPRRVFRIKEKKVIGHTLLVSGLTAEESIRLQETGVGGRRKLGCGVFVPTGAAE